MAKPTFAVKPVDAYNVAPVGIVTTPKGAVYACTWSPDTALTAEAVKAAWNENRRDFRPYDTARGCYVG